MKIQQQIMSKHIISQQLLSKNIFLIILITCCAYTPNNLTNDAETDYFLEVSFGNEFTNGYNNLRKWEQDIAIYVPDDSYNELNEELDLIIEEINDLSEEIELYLVDDEDDANYIIYFGGHETYTTDYEPNAAKHAKENWGLFWIYWDKDYAIYSGSMYVDTERVKDLDCQMHLLREELTQSLGLTNDSYDYSNSIFYQEWSCTTEYTEIDEILIEYILSADIEAGMTKQQVINIIDQ